MAVSPTAQQLRDGLQAPKPMGFPALHRRSLQVAVLKRHAISSPSLPPCLGNTQNAAVA
jgi:hypothetical protein